jgi:hypothetical protein
MTTMMAPSAPFRGSGQKNFQARRRMATRNVVATMTPTTTMAMMMTMMMTNDVMMNSKVTDVDDDGGQKRHNGRH